ncbi:MAG: hypothetical protein C5S38_01430 [Candidatus Methanophagaceae archaeon]|jgi:uncharacterized protein YuzE|nr:MAG: hypothetical protein C5S38_01430 [Methanophagales archaeon]KAF5436474.1 hypothetical protein C5S36_00170 [Methanophagales archaeon]
MIDREGDTLDMLIGNRQHAEDHGQIIVNYAEKGKIVEVVIRNASKLLGSILVGILKAPEREIVEIV